MKECPWGEFIEDLALGYEERFANDHTKKFSTPAISPAIYAKGATRCDESVLGWGGWMGIDIDNDGFLYTSFDDAIRFMTEIGCDFAIYTTTKATGKCHRLRVLFPLNRELGRDEIRPAWAAVCRKLDWLTPDSTCKDLSRIYSVPTIWQARSDGNPSPISLSWCRMDGGTLDIDAVLSEAPPTVAPLRCRKRHRSCRRFRLRSRLRRRTVQVGSGACHHPRSTAARSSRRG